MNWCWLWWKIEEFENRCLLLYNSSKAFLSLKVTCDRCWSRCYNIFIKETGNLQLFWEYATWTWSVLFCMMLWLYFICVGGVYTLHLCIHIHTPFLAWISKFLSSFIYEWKVSLKNWEDDHSSLIYLETFQLFRFFFYSIL